VSDLQKAGACRCGSCVARCQISSFTEGAKAIAASSGKAAGFHISLTTRTMRAPRTPHLQVFESTSLRADSKNEILIQLQVYLSALV
jgi:hypothetical protein